MADTYTTAIRARKIEPGTQPDAHGTLLNEDVFDLFDHAIAGTEAIDLGSSTTYALAALADGADSESRALRLNFSGTPASAVTVTVPASVTSKMYVVDNDCGQALTIKYAATSGVTVPDGGRQLAFADGTSVSTIEAGHRRSAAEIAAGVTPSNLSSEPGVFTRYLGSVASSAAVNTGALQDALDSNQRVEIHESGVHNFNDTILMNDDNLIVGKGTACVMMWNVTSRSLIEGVTKASARQFRWGIRDVTIDNTSSSNASAIAIDLSNLSDGTLLNVHVRNVATAYYGVSADGSLQNALFRCQALNVVTAMTLGTLTNEWKVYDLRVTDATNGVVINDNSGHKFYGLQVETFTGTGVTIGNTATAQSVLIDGVRLENLSAGSSVGFNLHATQAVNTVIIGLQPVSVNTLFSAVGTDTIVITGDRNSPELRCNQLSLGQGGIDNLSYAMIKATAAADASVRNSSDSGYADWRASDLYAARYLRLAGAALGAASTVTFGNATQSTVGAAGGASALPATPSGYLRFFNGTTEFVIPYYLQA